MAITKSAKKAIKQNKTRREYNLVYINNIKSTVKEVKALIAAKNVKEAGVMITKAYQALDKAAKVGVIKKNNASRKKSRLALSLAKISK